MNQAHTIHSSSTEALFATFAVSIVGLTAGIAFLLQGVPFIA